MGSLVHDIIYVEKYTLEIAHEKIYEDRNRPVMCGIVSMRHRIFLFSWKRNANIPLYVATRKDPVSYFKNGATKKITF